MTKKIDEMIDKLYMIREAKKELEAQIKELNSEAQGVEEELRMTMTSVGTDYARGNKASASITTTVVPQIDQERWEETQEWIVENDALYLLRRQINAAPWRELRDSGTEVPGIIPFTKTAISLRKLGD